MHTRDHDTAWIESHVREWVADGLIDREQARRILARESSRADVEVETERVDGVDLEPSCRLPLMVELSIDAATIVSLFAGAMAIGRWWDDLGVLGRVTVGLVVAIAGHVVARAIGRIDEPAARRLVGLFDVITAGGLAIATGVVVESMTDEAGLVAIAIGMVITPFGLWRWGNLVRHAQWLIVVAGAAILGGGVVEVLGLEPWPLGLATVVASSVVFAAAASGRMRPEYLVMVTASLGFVIGASMFGSVFGPAGLFISLAAAAAVVVAGEVVERAVVVAVGAFWFVVAMQGIVAEFLGGPLASSLVAVVAVAVLVALLVRTTHR